MTEQGRNRPAPGRRGSTRLLPADPSGAKADQANGQHRGVPAGKHVQAPEQVADERHDLIDRDEALHLVDDNPDTLVDERRSDGHPEQFGRPGAPMRRNSPFFVGFVGALGVLLAYVLAQAVASAGSVLVLLVVSLFLATGLNPAVEALMHRGFRRGLAVGCVFLGTILVFVGFFAIIVPPVVTQSQEFLADLPGALERLQRSEAVRDLNARYHVIDNLQAYLNRGDLGTRAFGGLLGFGKLLLGAVFSAFTVLILTLYFLASLPTLKRNVYRLVPASRRQRVALLGDEILLRIGGYVSGSLTVAAIAGIAVYVFLLIVGMPYPHALAVFAGSMSLVPMVGATVAMIVVTGVGLFHSVTVGIACAIYYLIYQQVENYVIVPRVMSKAVDVPPAATIIAALLGGALLGVLGALLAIPMAAAILLLVREVLMPRMDRT